MSFVTWSKARRDPALLKAAFGARLNEDTLFDAVLAEVNGTPTWAKRPVDPGSNNAGDLNILVDVDAAIAADFVASS